MPRASTAAASSPDRGYQLRLDEGVAPMSNSTPTRPEYGNRRATDRTSSGYRYWKKNTDLALISYGKIKTLLTKVFLTGGCEINSLISCVNSRQLKGFFFDVIVLHERLFSPPNIGFIIIKYVCSRVRSLEGLFWKYRVHAPWMFIEWCSVSQQCQVPSQ